MSFEPFNAVGGLSVGIPPIPVINENGVATLSGVQFSGLVVLGNVGNVKLYGGENGYFLQTDGAGGLTWAPAGNGGNGNGIPGGANSQVQFNDDGNFGGDAGFTYDKVANILTVTGNIAAYNFNSNTTTSNTFTGNVINVANVNATKISATGNLIVGNASLGNLATANFYLGNGVLLTGVISNFANSAGNITVSNQPNITSLGTLSNLVVSGKSLLGNVGNVQITGGVSGQVLTTDGTGNLSFQSAPAAVTATYVTANYQPNITSVGNLTFINVEGISNLGPVGNVIIAGGANGYILSTDGSGNLSWTPQANGGGIGGSNTQLQFNDAGNFAGSANLTYNKASDTMEVSGHLVANTFQMGAGAYTFSNSFVFFATTASTVSDQVLWDIPVANINAIDLNIFGTCISQNATQSAKISVLARGSTVVYNEYAGLGINGGVASYSVGYVPATLTEPATIALKVTPDYSAVTEYNMMITVYSNYP